MNKNAKNWVKVLRSGKYKQGKNQLRNEDTFCCLGVLCDLHSKEIGIQWDAYSSYLDQKNRLPPDVQLWAGLRSEHGSYKNLSEKGKINSGLITDNDRGKTFKEIADIIEKEQDTLFFKKEE